MRAVLVLLLCLAVPVAVAELVSPFVVSPQRDVERMMNLGEVGPDDYVIDLGSGDGRIVITAARRGAMGHGIELDPDLVEKSRLRAEGEGVADRVAFVHGDIFEEDFSRASVVTLYLFPEVNLRLRPMLLEQLAPGSRVISNSFGMGAWRADEHILSASSGGIYLWTVPARVAGEWRLRVGEREPWSLTVAQRFQQLTLDVEARDDGLVVDAVRLHGERLSFSLQGRRDNWQFSGRVEGDRMDGYVQIRDGDRVDVQPWTAELIERHALDH